MKTRISIKGKKIGKGKAAKSRSKARPSFSSLVLNLSPALWAWLQPKALRLLGDKGRALR